MSTKIRYSPYLAICFAALIAGPVFPQNSTPSRGTAITVDDDDPPQETSAPVPNASARTPRREVPSTIDSLGTVAHHVAAAHKVAKSVIEGASKVGDPEMAKATGNVLGNIGTGFGYAADVATVAAAYQKEGVNGAVVKGSQIVVDKVVEHGVKVVAGAAATALEVPAAPVIATGAVFFKGTRALVHDTQFEKMVTDAEFNFVEPKNGTVAKVSRSAGELYSDHIANTSFDLTTLAQGPEPTKGSKSSHIFHTTLTLPEGEAIDLLKTDLHHIDASALLSAFARAINTEERRQEALAQAERQRQAQAVADQISQAQYDAQLKAADEYEGKQTLADHEVLEDLRAARRASRDARNR